MNLNSNLCVLSFRLATGFVLLETFVAIPLLNIRLVFSQSQKELLVTSLAGAAILFFLVYATYDKIANLISHSTTLLNRIPMRTWCALVISTGVMLRLLWCFSFPAHPTSDAATYLHLATRIANGQTFESDGLLAYWPPGYAIFLAPFIHLFGVTTATVAGVNILLYLAAVWIIFRYAYRLGGALLAKAAILIFSFWPNLIATTGIASKELLIIPLWLAAISFWTQNDQGKSDLRTSLLPGALLGAATLIQPSLQLFPIVLLASELLYKGWKPALKRSIWMFLGMIVIISPWTFRNYEIFHRIVPVATNGGSNLYRANNPLANGGYSPRGEIDLAGLSEIEANKEGVRLAKKWITENPLDFLALSLEKQIRFLGEDGNGVYETLKRGRDQSNRTYVLWKAFANFHWLILLVLLTYSWVCRHDFSIDWLILTIAVMYLYGLHSVFESNAKYHVPLYGILSLLAAKTWILPRQSRSSFNSRILNFLAVGIAATSVQYLTLVALINLYGISVVAASSIGFTFSALLNYYFNYHLTFNSKRNHFESFPRFCITALAGLSINAIIIYLLTEFGVEYLVSQLTATVLVLAWNYFVNAVWTFKHKGEYDVAS